MAAISVRLPEDEKARLDTALEALANEGRPVSSSEFVRQAIEERLAALEAASQGVAVVKVELPAEVAGRLEARAEHTGLQPKFLIRASIMESLASGRDAPNPHAEATEAWIKQTHAAEAWERALTEGTSPIMAVVDLVGKHPLPRGVSINEAMGLVARAADYAAVSSAIMLRGLRGSNGTTKK